MSWQDLKPGAVGLAPMAGITDSPYRQLCREYGADFVMSEMISAAGVAYNKTQEMWDTDKDTWVEGSKSLEYARLTDKERPVILQIFGNEPKIMAEGAKTIIERFQPDGLDINMGCPARKVIKTGSGVALMDKPKLATEIVKAIKDAIGETDLSVKTRLGIRQNTINKLAPQLQEAGADAVIIHGRLMTEGFSGPVDYETIGKVVKELDIPVIANGGITSKKIQDQVIEITCAAATIIGQACEGNPFIFKQIKNPEYKPTWEEIKKTILKHTELQIKYRRDEAYAILEMRKHYGWYIRGFKNAAKLRQQLVRVKTLDDVKNIIESIPEN